MAACTSNFEFDWLTCEGLRFQQAKHTDFAVLAEVLLDDAESEPGLGCTRVPL